MPPKDLLGFAPSDWFTLALTVVLLIGGFFGRQHVRRAFTRMANRKRLCLGTVFALPIFLRLLLLPHHPVPKPEIYDEFSHLLVADTLWHHRLANPSHAMPEFFETFFELQTPTYSSIYALGPGLMLAIGRMISGVPWTGVLLTSGLLCAACYWMLLGFVESNWALMGGLLAIIQFGPLCHWTNTYWGGSLAATGGCLVFGSLARLRTSGGLTHAAILGAGFGLHLLSRQFESLLLFLSICLFAGPLIFDKKARAAAVAGVALLAVMPALILILLQNKEVTERWFLLPEALGQYEYGVPTSLTFQATPIPHRELTAQQAMDYRAQSLMHGSDPDSLSKFLVRLEYRVRYYRFFLLPPLYLAFFAGIVLSATNSRSMLSITRGVLLSLPCGRGSARGCRRGDESCSFPGGPAKAGAGFLRDTRNTVAVSAAPPKGLASSFLPWRRAAAPFALATRRYDILCALGCIVIFGLGTNFFPYLLPHYLAAVTGLFVLLSVVGLQRISRIRIRGQQAGDEVMQVLLVLCFAQFACWYSLHLFENESFYPLLKYETWDAINHDAPTKRDTVNKELAEMPGRLLVLVRYSPRHVYQDEWVWNAADIDGSRVVFARDLGSEHNQALVRYYPNRKVLLLDPDGFSPTLSAYDDADRQ